MLNKKILMALFSVGVVIALNQAPIATWYYQIFCKQDKVVYQSIQVPYAPGDTDHAPLNVELAIYRAPSYFYRRTLWVNIGGPNKQVDSIELILKQLPPAIKATHDVVMLDWRLHSNNRLSQAFINQKMDDCPAWLIEHAPYYGTQAAVHDMEYVRQWLGIEHLSLLGYSYGATLFTHYAAMYPEYVDAMVLDSPGYVQQTDMMTVIKRSFQWKAHTAQHKFKVLGRDFNQYLDFFQLLHVQGNHVLAPDGRRIEKDVLRHHMHQFFEIGATDMVETSLCSLDTAYLAIQFADGGDGFESDKPVALTKLDYIKAGLVFDTTLNELKEATDDEKKWLKALNKANPLPLLPSKSIVLSHPPLIVLNEYDPVVNADRTQAIFDFYPQSHTIEVKDSSFHAIAYSPYSLSCVDEAITTYLMDPSVKTQNLPLKCDAFAQTLQKYYELSRHLDVLQLDLPTVDFYSKQMPLTGDVLFQFLPL